MKNPQNKATRKHKTSNGFVTDFLFTTVIGEKPRSLNKISRFETKSRSFDEAMAVFSQTMAERNN
jgi:hypothetical protein